MSLLRANDTPVAEARLSLPRSGRGVGWALLASREGPGEGEPVTLAFQDGTEFAGTVTGAGLERGWWRVSLVLGANGLDKTLPSRYYQGIPASTVAKDILRECGEKAGPIDLPGTLDRYVRIRAPAYVQLGNLLDTFDRTWRIRPDGTVWIGVDDYAKAPPVTVVQARPEDGYYQVELTPGFEPGRTLVDREGKPLGKIERVVHVIGKSLYTEVYCAT